MRARWILLCCVLAVVAALAFVLLPSARRSAVNPPATPAPETATKTTPRRAAIPHPTKKRIRPPVPRAERAPSSEAPRAPDAQSTTVGASGEVISAVAEDTAVERGGVDPSLRLDAQGLSTVAERMNPSITACVDAWTAEVPEMKGHVVLAFQLGPEGVEEAWVSEHEAVPAGVLGCFSAAVYEQDWPAAPDGVEVTLPFDITTDEEQEDEGEAPPAGGMIDRRGEAAPR